MISKELFQQLNSLNLRYRKALKDSGDLSVVVDLIELTKQVIANPESDDEDIRSQCGKLALYLAFQINYTTGEEQKDIIQTYVALLAIVHSQQSYLFRHPDLRTRLLAMTRFLNVASSMKEINVCTLSEDVSLRHYLDLYNKIKKERRWPKKILRKIFDLYEWLPDGGECAVKTEAIESSGVVSVRIDYKSAVDDSIKLFRIMKFENSYDIKFHRFPSAYGLSSYGNTNLQMDSYVKADNFNNTLCELVSSPVAESWQAMLMSDVAVRHFGVKFDRIRYELEVIAESVTLSEEFRI